MIKNPEHAAALAELLAGCAGLAPDTSPYTFSKTPMDDSDTIGTQKENQYIQRHDKFLTVFS